MIETEAFKALLMKLDASSPPFSEASGLRLVREDTSLGDQPFDVVCLPMSWNGNRYFRVPAQDPRNPRFQIAPYAGRDSREERDKALARSR
jgi:hypothetical protein